MCFAHSPAYARCCCAAWGCVWALGENEIGLCQCLCCVVPMVETMWRQGDGNVFGRRGLSNVELLLEWDPRFGRATSQLPGWVFICPELKAANAELVYRPSAMAPESSAIRRD